MGTNVPPATVWADGRYLLAFKPLLVVASVGWPAENGVRVAQEHSFMVVVFVAAALEKS